MSRPGRVRPDASSQWRVCWRTRSPDGDQLDLAGHLVVDGPAQRAQRVDVLDLAAGAVRLARAAHRDVGVDAQRALLELAVGGADGHEDGAQLLDVGAGVVGRAQVGLRDDLEQRDAGPVVVHEGVLGAVDAAAAALVGGLAGVLLQVGPGDADAGAARQLEPAVDVERLVVLGDLEVLRHVRVEVVLPGEHARADLAVQRQADPDGQLHRRLVEHGQRAGQAERDRVDVGVGLGAELVAARSRTASCGWPARRGPRGR